MTHVRINQNETKHNQEARGFGGEINRGKEGYEAFGGEIAEAEVAENDLRGVEEVEGAAEVAAEEESLGLHVDVGGVFGEGRHFVGEENGRGVEVLAHAVPHHSPELLYLFLSHFFLTNYFCFFLSH